MMFPGFCYDKICDETKQEYDQHTHSRTMLKAKTKHRAEFTHHVKTKLTVH